MKVPENGQPRFPMQGEGPRIWPWIAGVVISIMTVAGGAWMTSISNQVADLRAVVYKNGASIEATQGIVKERLIRFQRIEEQLDRLERKIDAILPIVSKLLKPKMPPYDATD